MDLNCCRKAVVVSQDPLNFPRLLGKKIEELTREDLAKFHILPVDTEKHAKEFMNDNLSQIEIFRFKYNAGDVLKAIDPVAFSLVEQDELQGFLRDGIWIEIDGEIFDKAEIIEKFGLEEEE